MSHNMKVTEEICVGLGGAVGFAAWLWTKNPLVTTIVGSIVSGLVGGLIRILAERWGWVRNDRRG